MEDGETVIENEGDDVGVSLAVIDGLCVGRGVLVAETLDD